MLNFGPDPRFMYADYIFLLSKLRECGYSLVPFRSVGKVGGPKAIIRHDIDLSPGKAAYMAELERKANVSSTYFVMVSSSWYNLLDRNNEESIRRIMDLGHEVGLHFDASKYGVLDEHGLRDAVLREMDLLNRITSGEVTSVSWHIPNGDLLGKRLDFLERRGYANAYDPKFFRGYKYLSDSSMEWRENPDEFIDVKEYPNLQILTHPIWYTYYDGMDGDSIMRFTLEEREADDIAYLEGIYPGFRERNCQGKPWH